MTERGKKARTHEEYVTKVTGVEGTRHFPGLKEISVSPAMVTASTKKLREWSDLVSRIMPSTTLIIEEVPVGKR